jgi:phage terminase large subunit-like protein
MIDTPEWAKDLEMGEPQPLPQPLDSKTPEESLGEGEGAFNEIFVLEGVQFPRVAGAKIKAFSAEERAAWGADRFRCKTDQLFLAEVMGLDLTFVPHAALFGRLLKKQPGKNLADLDPKFKKRMILWHRGVAKTSAIRVEMTQIILNYPNVRLCFLTGSDVIAKKQAAALKQVFEKPTPEFLRLFPEYCMTSRQNKRTKEWTDVMDEMGTSHEFTVPARTSSVFADPTFAISTAKSVKAGSHYDFIFIDDLVNEVNSRSAPMLEKCYEDYLAICPLLDPNGYIVVTGTRYSFGDTYERIQEQAKDAGEANIWKFSIRGCYSEGKCVNCGHPEVFHDRDVNILQPPCGVGVDCKCPGYVSDGDRGPLFPEVTTRTGGKFGFTMERLEQIKSELGNQVFANQYLNFPLASEDQTFTEAMVGAQTIHEIKQIPGYQQASTFVVGDLAYGDNEKADSSVLYVCRKFAGQIFVFQCRAGKWGSAALVDAIIRICIDPDCRPQTIYLEKNLGNDALDVLIRARAAQLGLPQVPIVWIKPNQKKGAKGARISNIQESLKSKRLWLFAGMDHYEELVSELVRFPRTKKDDHADALGRVVEIGSTMYQTESGPQNESALNWLKKLHQQKDVDDYDSRPCGSY